MRELAEFALGVETRISAVTMIHADWVRLRSIGAIRLRLLRRSKEAACRLPSPTADGVVVAGAGAHICMCAL